MPRVSLPNNFTRRPYQAPFMRYFDDGGKRAMWVVHRRGGKDITAGHQTCKMMHREIGAYWHIYPTFAQGRRMLWEGFRKDGIRTMENIFPGFLNHKRPGSIVAKVDQGEMKVELRNGSIWRLIGSDRADNVGAGPKGIVLSEYALCKPTVWDLLRPMLRESGGWMAAITTPRGKNHAWDMYEKAGPGSGWFRDLKTVYDTNLTYASNRSDRELSPDEMMQEEREEGMEEALIRQEYLCDWTAAQVGSVYGDLLEALEKRGGMEAFEPDSLDRCYVTFDLGMTDDTDMFLWRLNGRGQYGVDVLRHYANHGKPMEHYFQKLDEWHQEGFALERLWLPHDAKAPTLVTGSSVMEMTAEACRSGRWGGCSMAIVPRLLLVDGLQAGRWLLQQNIRFHPRVAEAVEALKQYHYEYDEDAKTFSRKPEHDWSSHTADDFRYLALVVKHTELVRPRPAQPSRTVTRPPPTLDDLWTQRESNRGYRER